MVTFLFKHYLRLYLRSLSLMLGVGVFAILLVVVASLAFRTIGMTAQLRMDLTPGMLWLVILFSTTMLLHFASELDRDNGLLIGFAGSPVAGSEFFLGKLSATLVLAISLDIFILLAHQIFFEVDLSKNFSTLLVVCSMFSLGYVSLGILMSHVSSRVPGREVLFPLIVFPISLPAIVASITLTRNSLIFENIAWNGIWVAVLLCFGAISCAISWLLFDEVLQA